jgi:thioredoxin
MAEPMDNSMAEPDARILRCPQCGQSNRVPPLGSGKKAVCGSCHAPLDGGDAASAGATASGGKPVTVTDASFASTISKGKYVVDFWAAWCGPCRMIGPVIDALAAERSDVTFAKLNVDENPRTSAQFSVQGIPLLIFFRDGAETGRVVGAVPRPQIEAAIQRYLG